MGGKDNQAIRQESQGGEPDAADKDRTEIYNQGDFP